MFFKGGFSGHLFDSNRGYRNFFFKITVRECTKKTAGINFLAVL